MAWEADAGREQQTVQGRDAGRGRRARSRAGCAGRLHPELSAALARRRAPGAGADECRASWRGRRVSTGRGDRGDTGRQHARRPPRAGQGAVCLDQDHARRPDPDLGRRSRGHGQFHGGAAAVPGSSSGRVRDSVAAVDAHQGPDRKICLARGHEGLVAAGAVEAREVRLHGAAGAYRSRRNGRR